MKIIKIILLYILFFCSSLYSQNMTIHYIDIGQGDSELIQYQNINYLIDSGVNRSDNKLISYLDSIGVDTIHAVLMTHPHYDHYGEFEDLIESGVVVLKFIRNKDYQSNSSFQSLLTTLQNYNIPIDTVDYLDSLKWIVETDILSPDYNNNFSGYNNNSIVFIMEFESLKFIFTGDSETENNNYLINNYNIDIDVLKVNHHGADNGTNYNYLQAMSPIISVISSGANSYGHPSHNVIDMINNTGSLFYSTTDDCSTWTGNGSNDYSVNDDIVLETDGFKIWINGQLVYTPSGSEERQEVLTEKNIIFNVSPNPARNYCHINFDVSGDDPQPVRLKLYNINGQLIETLINEILPVGFYSIEKRIENTGVYFFHLSIDKREAIIKVINY